MLGFIQKYGQLQAGKCVNNWGSGMQLLREQEARENLNAQLARELSQKGEARAQGEFERAPEREAATRQQALNVASIGAIPSLSDATRGSLRLLNPDYAAREEAQKVVERDKQLQSTRAALEQADSPKKKKAIIEALPDPEMKRQLLGELEQEGKNKVGGEPHRSGLGHSNNSTRHRMPILPGWGGLGR
jgi:hypothetical protein